MVTHFTDETVEGKCKACPGNTKIAWFLLMEHKMDPVKNKITIDSCLECPDGNWGKLIEDKEVWKGKWDIYKVNGVDTCIC
jgi:hypothetical protein